MTFLNKELITTLQNKIESSPIFSKDDSLKNNYDLICAVLNRLDTAITYLNEHSEYPNTEHDFLVFMMYCSMIKDASQQLANGLEIHYTFSDNQNANNFKFFKSYCIGEPLNLDEIIVPTDDKFFEYFRSVAFAHPFETSRVKFLKQNDKEIHYSPFVIVNNNNLFSYGEIKDAIGVRVYTNKAEGWSSILDIKISFNTLKNFIKSRYNFLQEVSKWAQEQIDDFKQNWQTRKVNRSLPNVEILKDIIEILKMRYQSTYEIEDILDYLETEVTLSTNRQSVVKFQNMIIKYIPKICDAVDEFDYEFIYKIIYEQIEVTPRNNVESETNYQLEKIFSYLNNNVSSDNVSWGLKMAKEFSQGFAKEYVTIHPENMSFLEIKLLVRTACYLKTV